MIKTLSRLLEPFTHLKKEKHNAEKKTGQSHRVHHKWGRGNLIPGGVQILLCSFLFLKPPWGWKRAHTVARTNVTHTHTHWQSIAPRWKKDTWLPWVVDLQWSSVWVKLLSAANHKHHSLREAVHGGTSSPLVDWPYSFIQCDTL